MKTSPTSLSLIRESTRLLADLSRRKRPPVVPGIERCDSRLLLAAHTLLPLFIFPGLCCALAAAPWLALPNHVAAAAVGGAVFMMALLRGRQDRQWFHATLDFTTRTAGNRMSNRALRDYLRREYLPPLWRPGVVVVASCLIPFVVPPAAPFYNRFARVPISLPIDYLWLHLAAGIPISAAAALIAIRRPSRRPLTVIPEPIRTIEPAPRYGPQYIRGAQITTLVEAIARQAKLLPKGDPGILWGPVCLRSDRCEHFFILAVTRGGKTVVLRLILQDTLYKVGNPLAKADQRARALVYDPKPELLPYLFAIQPYAKYIITNPADARGMRWDIAKDFSTPSSAAELARLMVPIHLKQRDSFYPKAIRALLTQVLKAFMLSAPGVWTLRDVFQVFKSEDDLRLLLSLHEQTRGALERLSRNAETRGNIDISIFVELEPFLNLAARWHHASSAFSLEEWMQSESVLVVGRVDAETQMFDAINSLLLNRVSELLLSQQDRPDIRTYLYLDELATLSGFTKLEMLMTNGLSKFVSVVLASQGIEGLRQQFGNESTETILSMCGNMAFMRLSRTTAEWAANQIGKTDWLEVYDNWSYTSGMSHGGGTSSSQGASSTQSSFGGSSSSTWGSGQQRNERYAMMPEQFQHIARPDKNLNIGLQGTFISDPGSAYGILPAEIPADSLFNKLLMPADSDVPAFIPRPTEHDILPRWTDEDRQRLGLNRAPLDTFLR